MAKSADFWQKTAAAHWENIGSPFRPSQQDSRYLDQMIQNWPFRNGSLRAVVLGATPEMADLNWPEGTQLLAVDASQQMIDNVWPGFPKPGEGALCANWLDLPLKNHSCDLVIGDGSLNTQRYPDGYRKLLRSVYRILQPHGWFGFRMFLQADTGETPGAVYECALNGDIKNFHAFKFRLFIALQTNIEKGVRMGDVWNHWREKGPAPNQLAQDSGWSLGLVNSIEYYRGKDFVLTCPTLEELRALLDEEGFEEMECLWPTYEAGEQCPTIVCKKGAR